ncbi:carbonic anhydrase 4-like isoform X1 [Myxocyprinus asiaticus]|uniref:carbonic anhydrase 4-like isoform X1 n=1 Tax=Myxocyprinus asiaticus TaxID=70543 RepID=UPI0022234A99|nr:carbonic anhydrase 4-like isoform X1 [Myxocyprinus asiaticus]
MQCLLSSYLLSLILHLCTGADWCYQTQVSCDSHCKGPDQWREVHAECGNTRQSPINIVTKKTKLDERLTPFKFNGYQNVFDSTIRNNGHSVQVNIPITATVSGGNLKEIYKAVQFHLHWGTDGGPGSEHTIDGEQYPMELHIVHMKQRYNRLEDALKDPSGVAVLGFFYEESSSTNRKYDLLTHSLRSVQNANGNTTLRKISLNQLILSEGNLTNYYRYNGSLTTPGCTEAVVWTVFENPIPLDREQLRAFSSLRFHDGKPMVDTFRPVQPLNGRFVYRSSGAAVLASTILLFASIITTYVLFHLN